jgi:hypothetical protein
MINIKPRKVIRIDNQLHLEPILKMLDLSGYKWADGVNLLDWQLSAKCCYLFVHANYTVTWTSENSCYDDYTDRYEFCTSTKMLSGADYSIDTKTDVDSDLKIKKVIFNEPATIIIWNNGTKTVVKCQEGDEYDKEKGFAMCITKKFFGNKSKFNNVMKEWIK